MSGHVSEPTAVEATRRRLTGKRADTVLRLGDATVEALRQVGYSDMTVPMVAAHAGMARATAYIYFSSKEHLVAEVYWRRLASISPADNDAPGVADRVVAVLRQLALLVADEPEFAGAVTKSLLSDDADVVELRTQVSRVIHKSIAAAVGTAGDSQTIELIELIYTGAMVRAGTGHFSYDEVADQMESAVRRILD